MLENLDLHSIWDNSLIAKAIHLMLATFVCDRVDLLYSTILTIYSQNNSKSAKKHLTLLHRTYFVHGHLARLARVGTKVGEAAVRQRTIGLDAVIKQREERNSSRIVTR